MKTRNGFTILELLVASMLLGMLLTILTMLFNQSSIAWRTGMAGVVDLDDTRSIIAEKSEMADNAYVWDNRPHVVLGLWESDGKLRTRAWSVGQRGVEDSPTALQDLGLTDNLQAPPVTQYDARTGHGAGGRPTYTINVKSAGPNRRFNDEDDIWSYPNDIDF